MKTINIMKQLIAKHFDSKDEFVKELNNLCDIVEEEQENDREMRQIADMKYNTLPYCTNFENHCKLWDENENLKKALSNYGQPFDPEISEMSESVEVER